MKLKSNTLYFITQSSIAVVPNVISINKTREMIFGHTKNGDQKDLITNIFKMHVEARIKEQLTTIVEEDGLNKNYQLELIKLAKQFNMDIENISNEQILNSSKNYSIIPNDKNIIPKDVQLDVIGDIHGHFDYLQKLLYNLGYDKQGVHPEGRKLLFLGDLVDRGPKSYEVLIFVMKLVRKHNHYMVIGNHEDKTIRTLDKVKLGHRPKGNLIHKELIEKIINGANNSVLSFLKSLPTYYIQGDYVFAHANLQGFNFETGRSELIFGSTRAFSKISNEDFDDEAYQSGYEQNENKYKLIRGHIRSKNTYTAVYSLEQGQSFLGSFVALQMDKIKDDNYNGAIVTVKSEFNGAARESSNNLLFELDKLKEQGLITSKTFGLFTIFKYTKKITAENLWFDESLNLDLLRKSRGLVLDFSGKIVVHSFDKTFNYFESDPTRTVLNTDDVIAVKKENGFLGNISYNPYTNSLIYSSTNSIMVNDEGHKHNHQAHVNYIKEFISKSGERELIKFLKKNRQTLSFEVLHKEDEHIISRDSSSGYGLVLIGARDLDYDSQSKSERELDTIASKFGFKRPQVFEGEFGDIKKSLRKTFHEGYMIRDVNSNKILLKLKTPFYLIFKHYKRNKFKYFETKTEFDKYSSVIKPFKTEFFEINNFFYNRQELNNKSLLSQGGDITLKNNKSTETETLIKAFLKRS